MALPPPSPSGNPLQRSLELLRSSRNPVAAEVLAHLLDGPRSELRRAAVTALSKRPEEQAAHWLALHFHELDEVERQTAGPRILKIPHFIQQMLMSSLLRQQRAALAVAVQLNLASLQKPLLAIADNPAHALAQESQEQIKAWAMRMGEQVRGTGKGTPARLQLIDRLMESLRSMPQATFDNPSATWSWKLESLLSAMHWDDHVVRAELYELRLPFATAMRQLVMNSQSPGILQWLSGFLWQRHMPDWIRTILETRADLALALVISKKAAQQVTANLRNHLTKISALPCLQTISIDQDDLPVLAKVGAYRLLAMTSTSVRATLQAAISCLELREEWSDQVAAELLHMVPSGSSNKTPPRSPKEPASGHTELLLRLLDYFARSSKPVQEAIRRLFASFTLDEMARHVEDWDERMLHNAAHIIQVIDPAWADKLRHDLESVAPLRRSRAMHLLEYMGIPDSLWDAVLNRLHDEHQFVRDRVVDALVASQRSDAEDLLLELANDFESDLQQAAQAGLLRLESQSTIGLKSRNPR